MEFQSFGRQLQVLGYTRFEGLRGEVCNKMKVCGGTLCQFVSLFELGFLEEHVGNSKFRSMGSVHGPEEQSVLFETLSYEEVLLRTHITQTRTKNAKQ